MKRLGGWILAGMCLLLLGPTVRSSGAADKPAAVKQESVAADKKALAPFQTYVGEWKGVGQPRRGSSQGAWSEQAGWAWHFTDQHAELTAQISHDPYFSGTGKGGPEKVSGTVF
jgi:hypothetical protein